MLAFALNRVLQAIPVVILSTLTVFLLMRLVPGDPARMLAGADATPEVVEAVRHEMGLDQPLPIQYLTWGAHVLSGDLGNSIISKVPVSKILSERVPATMELTFAAMLLTLLIAIPTGIFAAIKPGSAVDWIVTSINGITIAVPGFWLGILCIILFGVVLGWLPPGGRGDFSKDPLIALKFLFLPALTLSLASAASLSRLVKSSMLEVLYEEYVLTARAKGLTKTAVVIRHALRNALVPVITVMGLQFGRLLGGAVITEQVFAWPGVGRMILDAIGTRDYPIVQGALLMMVFVYLIVNLLTDLAYGVLDPRVRVGARAAH
jgi:peptide/nickel transport system permease protein